MQRPVVARRDDPPRPPAHFVAFGARAVPAKMGTADEQTRLAEDIGWAVTRAARYLPFKAVCLPQAMAARVMLERRGVKSIMHFGAAKGAQKPLDARLARRRRRRSDRLSGGEEFRRDCVFRVSDTFLLRNCLECV